MKYIEFINGEIKKAAAGRDDLFLFGQNINAGSYVSGFTKGLRTGAGGRIINSTNTENSLVGFGFGLMLSGAAAVFFVKQLDFVLLGIDQIVNTFNSIRNREGIIKGSFTIMPIVVDSGYQGLQSSLNNLSDFCSIARVSGFTVTNKHDAEMIISSQMVSPGFRIIAISQRLFGQEILVPEKCVYQNKELTVFQYEKGNDVTIVCFNFSYSYGKILQVELQNAGLSASLFNVNSPIPVDWGVIIDDVTVSKRLVVLDDSKSENLSCYSLLAEVLEKVKLKRKIVIKRVLDEKNWLTPQSDILTVDSKQIIKELL